MSSRVPPKHPRESGQDFEGLLNNLQDWELSFKDKDKKLKSQPPGKGEVDLASQRRSVGNQLSNSSKVGEIPTARKAHNVAPSGKHDYLKDYDALSKLSSSILTTESSIDATSEKELGNEYFKKKNYNEAIDCYSRSIALLPTAVAFANRAMAYIKIKRFQEAESDCTEALNLDDSYTKAYSRRSTARRELGKLKESLDDAEFALRLEPQNQELKKQYTEVKSLLEKDIVNKLSQASSSSLHGSKKAVTSSGDTVRSTTINSDSKMIVEMRDDQPKDGNDLISSKTHGTSMQTKDTDGEASRELAHGFHLDSTKGKKPLGRQELKPSLVAFSTQVASLAKAEAAKNISPPTTAMQFEDSWQAFSGDRHLQARLLKATSPTSLPQIFNARLSAPLLLDIVKCIGTFFSEEMDLAVKYLQNITKIPRFDMIVMCLSSQDKSDLAKLWNESFSKATPEYAEILGQLRSKYRVASQK